MSFDNAIMLTLPPQVAELLEPISGVSPTGVDLDPNVKEYTELEQEITKMTPNYAGCVATATKLLQSKSKHLRVAALLGFAWYRTEKITGLSNAMLLLAGLIERYTDKLFPANPQHRIKHIQLLSTEKVTKFVARELGSVAEAQAALAAYQHLVSVCAKHFPQNGPVLTALGQILEKHVGSPGGRTASDQLSVTSNQLPASSAQQPATGNQQPVSSDELPATSDQQSATSNQQPASNLEPPASKFEIPEAVAELLKPISANAPTGRDVTKNNDEDYQEYLALQSEIKKIKPNYEACIELATTLLKNKCKDLEAMVWLTFAWFGKRKIAGLKDGSLLLLNALERFGDKLYPEDGLRRSRSLNFLNHKEVGRILTKEKAVKENAKDILTLQKIWRELEPIYLAQFGAHFKKDQVSPFKPIGEALAAHAEAVEEFLKSPSSAPATQPTTSTTASGAGTTAPKPSTGPSLPSSGVAITSNDSARQAIRKGLLFFFEEEKDGKKTRKVVEDVAVYALARELRWSKLILPEYKDKDEGKIAAIEGPTPEKQAAIKNWVANSEWDTLIPDIEVRFLNDEGFVYWLDGQRYVVQALEAKGGKWNQAAQEIKFHLARLLQRVPELPKLMFKDKKTPFVDNATMKWLEEEVKGMLGSGKGAEKILPPIMGEEYEAINKEYEAACGELPENFQKHAEMMQQAIAGDMRRKGRFLRGLNLANYCLTAKKPELAKALLADLMKKIEAYQLTEWEPALCVAVWQSAYLANLKLLHSENHVAAKADLHTQQRMLFDQIGKHDCVRALELANRQPADS